MRETYVYALIDPTNKTIFYIGKGTGYRDSSHMKPSMWKNPEKTSNPFLYYKIKSLMDNDTPPQTIRLLENVSEEEAYEYENQLIIKYGRRFVDGGILFNISDFKGGSFHGRKKPWSEERRINHKKLCKNNRMYNPTYDELYRDYILNNFTREQISIQNNISESLVKKRLQEYNIIKPKENLYPKKNKFICIKCDRNFFTPKSVSKRKYCSRKCYRSIDEIS